MRVLRASDLRGSRLHSFQEHRTSRLEGQRELLRFYFRPRRLGFLNVLIAVHFSDPFCIALPNFADGEIGHTVAEIAIYRDCF